MDDLTIPQLNSLTAYWAEHPPTHISLAVIAKGLGAKLSTKPKVTKQGADVPVATTSNNEVSEEDMSSLIAIFGAPVTEIPV